MPRPSIHLRRCLFLSVRLVPYFWLSKVLSWTNPSSKVIKRRHLCQYARLGETDERQVQDSSKLNLPVFPLRKTVRLPTEELILNLYEDRYLSMAEYILGQSHNGRRMFGAMYASKKPQIVKRGTGPVVPLIEIGDIGVVFLLTRWEDDMIQTVGGGRRRRIRLISTGIARFQVMRILQNGFGGSKNGSANDLPFILSEVQVLLPKQLATMPEHQEPVIEEIDSSHERAMEVQDAFATDTQLHSIIQELKSFEVASSAARTIKDRLAILHLDSVTDRLRLLREGIF